MNQSSTKDILARGLSVVAFLLAVVCLVLLGVSNSGQAGQTAGGIGGKTSTEGTYIAQNGFGVGTEQSFTQIFSSSGKLQTGSTCALIVNTTIAATSTKNYDCAVTGVTPNDIVLAGTIASSTPAQGSVFVVGASASSTAGFITFTVVNLTGAVYNPATTGFGSSTPYLIIK